MADFYGKGIPVGAGFDLGTKCAIDNRTLKATIAERNAMPIGIIPEGLVVYVEETKKNYQFIEGEWVCEQELVQSLIDKVNENVSSSASGLSTQISTLSTNLSNLSAQVISEVQYRKSADDALQTALQTVSKNLSTQITSVQSNLQSVSKNLSTQITSVQSNLQSVSKNLGSQVTSVQGSLQSVYTTLNQKIDKLIEGDTVTGTASRVQYSLQIGTKVYNGSQAVTITQDELLSWSSLQKIFAGQGITLTKGSIAAQKVTADNLVTYEVKS